MQVRNAMISGAWSNSNYDPQKEGEDGARQGLIESIMEQYVESVDMIYGRKTKDDSEIDWDNPFFGAMKLPPKIDDMPGSSVKTTYNVDQE